MSNLFFEKIVEENVDIDLYPQLDPFLFYGELTLGDLHGNALKLLYFLVRHRILEINQADYKLFVELYYKATAYTQEDIEQFNSILLRTQANPHSKVRLIGDILADRGKNDYFTLKILEKLKKENVDYEIELSNHDAEFLLALSKVNKNENKKLYSQIGEIKKQNNVVIHSQCPSMDNLQKLIDENIITLAEVNTLVQQFYQPALKALNYSLSEDKKHITIYSHAKIDCMQIKYLADAVKLSELNGLSLDEVVSVKRNDNGQEYLAFNQNIAGCLYSEWLAKMIDAINEKCAEHPEYFILDESKIQKVDAAYHNTWIELLIRYKKNMPFEMLAWNRCHDSRLLDRKLKQNDCETSYVHGHDLKSINEQHVITLDNILGKRKNGEVVYYNDGTYKVNYKDNSNGTYEIIYTHGPLKKRMDYMCNQVQILIDENKFNQPNHENEALKLKRKKFAQSVYELHSLIVKDIQTKRQQGLKDHQILECPALNIADETNKMLADIQSFHSLDQKSDAIIQQDLNRLNAYRDKCITLANKIKSTDAEKPKSFLNTIALVAGTAAGAIVGAAAGVIVGLLTGTVCATPVIGAIGGGYAVNKYLKHLLFKPKPVKKQKSIQETLQEVIQNAEDAFVPDGSAKKDHHEVEPQRASFILQT
ncbi:MAG: hypothetical protein A3F12_04475 [Gammaproteobacteria bacterium RIFCSPHIGHO2_12_FULL_38_14]|nr:MAG: hypothetical protein A3F12_04475 [Gammaproteobacteria bacterium RIFCSPHIGHO2_12_FULL_38_14]